MPSPFTSSFASAAAGKVSSEGTSNSRNAGSGDWSRARTNGATTTFRRPSGAANVSQRSDSNQTNINPPTSAGAVYVPPHLNSNYHSGFGRNGATAETRYSKDQLLDLFRAQQDKASPNLDDLFVDGWKPPGVNGTGSRGWIKNDEHKEVSGPEICWDHGGNVQPLSLLPMSEEERDVFAHSVNSPLKPPAQNKDGTPNAPTLNRRTSLTQTNANNLPSRPGVRQRRDSSDLLHTSSSLTSPTANNRFSKDDSSVTSPPPSLLRRKTDYKDTCGPSLDDKDKDVGLPGVETSSFGPLKRANTNPLGALSGPSSPWSGGPSSAGFAPMGAFGSFGSSQTPTEKKSGFGSGRSESRFKSLMGGDSSENVRAKPREQTSLERVAESRTGQAGSLWESGQPTSQRDLKDFSEEDDQPRAGSAALGGDDPGPTLIQTSRSLNPDRRTSYDEVGFSSRGPNSDLPFHEWSQRGRDYGNQQTPQPAHVNVQSGGEPLSPTYTNPYLSPEGDKSMPEDIDTDDSDPHHLQYHNIPYARSLHSQLDHTIDRSRIPSQNASRALPHHGGLGGLSGLGGSAWSAAPGVVGTPSRAFGESAFGGFGDVGSPGLSSVGAGGGFFGSVGPSSAGIPAAANRGSKLGSLFPNVAQDQSRNDPQRQDQGFGENDGFQTVPGTNAPGFSQSSLPDTSSPSNMIRSRLDDLLSSSDDRLRSLQSVASSFASSETVHAPVSSSLQTPFPATAASANYFSPSQEQDQSSASQLPASQQRQMVMPDRMRWIYRDPQGNQQGPWSGLEMHDWYKAGFFSPELQVKKLEETEYEPLAQLIRRIGNSREPFLVPQIGIPHGPPSALPNASATAAPSTTPSAASSSAQPPFASSFPSFGTTLTAEQQNALERRKQEEQYLMARQKEHLAALQPVLQRQMQQHMQSGLHNQQLHHHSSAHSLQSQPSFGSITSPVGYQPSPAAAPIQPPSVVPGFFDGLLRNAAPLGGDALSSVRQEDLPGFMERMNLGRGGQMPYTGASQSQDQYHQQQTNAILQEKARLQREQEQYDATQRPDDPRITAERYDQFQQLRAQEGERQQLTHHQAPIGVHVSRQPEQHQNLQGEAQGNDERLQDQLSLSEQVQKAAAKQSPGMQQPQSPWSKVDPGMPQPFPPPQSSSPMPAPTPQRNRQSVADALNAESQSQTPSQADSAGTPSAAIAPWAKESTEGSKGPSLKEIQAMEARKAAQQEEIAAATRRAVVEQERLAQRNQTTPPAPGLPSTANWASSMSPALPTAAGASPWAKSAVGKPSVATPVSGTKKTLAQIQKEEEARKNRAATAAAAAAAAAASVTGNPAAATNATAVAVGKRYADLASKATLATAPNTNNTAWTTVGAGGKVKISTAPVPATRTANAGMVPSSASSAAKPKPTISTAVKNNSSNQQSANEEFQKWTKNALGRGLNSNIPIDDFVSSLLHLPPEPDIISEAIYASSQTLDGRRFAEEFVRRRKLADRGIMPDSTSHVGGFSSSGNANESKSNGNGGWSEVAKKGGQTVGGQVNEGNGQFRVVSGKKKGGKR
ncbi:MAG: hypothetical protein Q9163_005388 [Psora crenata]